MHKYAYVIINNVYKYIYVVILRKCFASHLGEFLSGVYEEDRQCHFLKVLYSLQLNNKLFQL